MYRITLQNTVLQSTPKETAWALLESSNRILISVTLLLYLRLLYTNSIGKKFLNTMVERLCRYLVSPIVRLDGCYRERCSPEGGTGGEAPVLLTFPRDSHLVVVSK